jgi:hypothetical protein
MEHLVGEVKVVLVLTASDELRHDQLVVVGGHRHHPKSVKQNRVNLLPHDAHDLELPPPWCQLASQHRP